MSLGTERVPEPRREKPGDRLEIGSDRAQARAVLSTYRITVMLADAIIAGACVAAAVVFRFNNAPTGWYAVVPIVLPFVWVALLASYRTYDDRFLGSGPEEFTRIFRGGLALFTAIAVFSFCTVGNVSRSIVLASVPATMLGSMLARKVARAWLHRERKHGRGVQRTLVVGRDEAVGHLVDRLLADPDEGLRPIGVCVPRGTGTIDGVPVVGTPEAVIDAVDRTGANVVAVVSHPDFAGHPLRQLSWALEERDVELMVSPGIVEVAGPRLSIRPVAGLSLLHLERPSAGTGAVILKTLFDRITAAVALLLLSPALAAIAILVKATSPGPVFFRQTRVGVHGKEFTMTKFRSMVPDAEEQLIDLRDNHDGNHVLFKMKSDPRVTKVGGILRRFSLDELPQLFNVLKGEMSLVGPRPPLPEEVARYEPDAVRRLHVRPGITGLWQVSGRSDLNWEQSLRLDLRYVDNWSLALDITILWRTARAVFGGSGAY